MERLYVGEALQASGTLSVSQILRVVQVADADGTIEKVA